MCFWVFENIKHCYIKIHTSACHACNNTRPTITGRWRGPFESYNEAREWATSAGRNVDCCKFCNPQEIE